MSSRICCLECLALAWYAITSNFRNVEPANPEAGCLCEVELKRKHVTAETLQAVMSKPPDKLVLTNCTFDEVSSGAFCNAALEYLEIYSPIHLKLTDGLSALADMKSLRTLILTRTDFMNADGGRCYAALARMTHLEALNLDRTITREKAPTRRVEIEAEDGSTHWVDRLDPIVMESLEQLVKSGNLRTLSLQWCTALTAEDVERLRGIRRNCEIVWKPSKQASSVQASGHQGTHQPASGKEHDD